jgi:Fe2+ or Zn2+ uptake regulation protein
MQLGKRTTTTRKIQDILQLRNDFMTARQIMEAIKEPSNRTYAALHWLQKARVIQSMASDGQLWFYLTLEEDRRTCTVDEIKDNIKKRIKPRRIKPTSENPQ